MNDGQFPAAVDLRVCVVRGFCGVRGKKCWTYRWEANVATVESMEAQVLLQPSQEGENNHGRRPSRTSGFSTDIYEYITHTPPPPTPPLLPSKSLTRLFSLLAVFSLWGVFITESVRTFSFFFFINILPHSYFMHFTALLLHRSDY